MSNGRSKECPNCGQDISDTYESVDYETGIMTAGWYCDTCDTAIVDDDDGDYDDYE